MQGKATMNTKLKSIIVLCAALALGACNESSKSADPAPASNPNAGGTSTDTTPPTVSASVKTGTFSSPQAVVLTCTDAGGSGCKTIYYTTDSTAPTANSTAFSGSIAIGVGVTTLKYIAVDVAGNVSSIATETYTVSSGGSSDSTPPTVSASVKTGTYSAAQSIMLTCNDGAGSGCKAIYYTINGTSPSTAATTYTSAIAIGAGVTTLKFLAVDNSGNVSLVGTETYTVNITAPDTTPPTVSASVKTGTYTVAQSVVLSCNDGTGSGCKAIYYTTDGSTPTTASTNYTSAIAIGSGTTVLKFIAVDNANNASAVATETYTVTITVPDTTPPAVSASVKTGTYTVAQSVVLSCNDGTGSGCKAIYYSTDGVPPTTNSATYTSAIAIGSGTTKLQFMAIDNASNFSVVATETYTVTIAVPDTTPPTVSASVKTGTYTVAQSVVLSCNDGTGSGCKAIYYSTDGSTPATTSTNYTSAIAIGSGTTVLKFIAVDNANNASAVATEMYTVNIPVPDTTPPTVSASVKTGTYTVAQNVVLTCDDGTGSGCKAIYYTTDGSAPTTSSAAYSVALTIGAGVTTLNFIAVDNVNNTSAVVTETYTVNLTAPNKSGALTIDRIAFDTPRVVVDQAGVIHVAYLIRSTDTTVEYGTCAADCGLSASWSFVVVDTVTFASGGLQLAVGVDGRVHLTYIIAAGQSVSRPHIYATCATQCTTVTNWSKKEIPALRDYGVQSITPILMAVDAANRVSMLVSYTGVTALATCGGICDDPANWTVGTIFNSETNASLAVSGTRLHMVLNTNPGSPSGPFTNGTIVYQTCDANCSVAANWQVSAPLFEYGPWTWGDSDHTLLLAVTSQGGVRLVYNQNVTTDTSPLDLKQNDGKLLLRSCDANCMDPASWSGLSFANEFPKALGINESRTAILTNKDNVLQAYYCNASCSDSASWQAFELATSKILNAVLDPYSLAGCTDGSNQYIRPYFASFYPENARVALGTNNAVVVHSSSMLRTCSFGQPSPTGLPGFGRILYLE
jgi:hypothetical protein